MAGWTDGRGARTGYPRWRALGPACALALVLAGAASAVPVEPSHPVYGLLRRLEARGLAPSGYLGTLPWDSEDIAARLEAAASAAAAAEAGQDALPSADRERLQAYLEEFSPARRRAATVLKIVDSAYALHAGARFWGAGYVQDSLPEGQRSLFGTFSPYVEATFWNDGYIHSSGFIGMERSSLPRFTETYRPEDGLPYNTSRLGKMGIPQGVSTMDGFRVVLGYGKGPLRLEAGQDWNQWGPGHWQHATLGGRGYFWVQDSLAASDTVGFPGTRFPGRHRRGYSMPGESAPMPQLRLKFQSGRFTYVKVVAQRDGVVADQTATLVAHRLEWRATSFLTFGGTELASIGGRVPEAVHWLPLVPLKIMEHQVRDKDNLALSVDVEARKTGWGRAYGELYLDDFSGPPFGFWGNKFAYTLGLEWIDPFHVPGALRMEFAHVDPWVFTHHLPGRQHQHAGALYGSALPANARALWMEAAFPVRRDLEASVQWRMQQRDLRSRGSSLFDVYIQGAEDREKQFLEDTPETRHEVALDATWHWRRHVDFRAGAGFLWVDDWKGKAGETLAASNLLGELVLRY